MLEFTGVSTTLKTSTRPDKALPRESQLPLKQSGASSINQTSSCDQSVTKKRQRQTTNQFSKAGSSKQISKPSQAFVQMFTEMNEKAIESMNKDEPETALEFLKKADETLSRTEQTEKSDTSSSRHQSQQSNAADGIDSNYKAALYYNLACCYQRLGMLEECVDYLELATK